MERATILVLINEWAKKKNHDPLSNELTEAMLKYVEEWLETGKGDYEGEYEKAKTPEDVITYLDDLVDFDLFKRGIVEG